MSPIVAAIIRILPSLGGLRRLGMAMAVAALVIQMLAPLAVPPPAWAEEGLFPPTCSIHVGTAGDNGAADLAACTDCPLCQLHAVDRVLLPPDRVVSPAFAAMPVNTERPDLRVDEPTAAAVHPPLPSRGPPSAA